jgi:hypothetical protein
MWCALLRAIKPLIDNLPATALSYNEAFPIRLLRWWIPVRQTTTNAVGFGMMKLSFAK